jgi:hypothetical protein
MMELVTGTFARRAERAAFDASHPLNLLWQTFADEIAPGIPTRSRQRQADSRHDGGWRGPVP